MEISMIEADEQGSQNALAQEDLFDTNDVKINDRIIQTIKKGDPFNSLGFGIVAYLRLLKVFNIKNDQF